MLVFWGAVYLYTLISLWSACIFFGIWHWVRCPSEPKIFFLFFWVFFLLFLTSIYMLFGTNLGRYYLYA